MKLARKIAHLFSPTHSNNHRARVLHPPVTVGVAVLLIIFQALVFAAPKAGLGVLGYAANISPEEVVRLTNLRRAEVGLSPLTFSDTLSSAARSKGSDMLEYDYWAHVSPNGVEPWKFFIDAGYTYKYAGENLARDFADPGSAVEAWMASPTHKDNILSPKYTEIGVAVVEGDVDGVDTTFIVQHFGTPMGASSDVAPVAVAVEAPLAQEEEVVPLEDVARESEGGLAVGKTVSPFDMTQKLSVGVVGVFLGALAIDGALVSKRKISRLTGRTIAHLSFLGMILAIVLLARAGQVL